MFMNMQRFIPLPQITAITYRSALSLSPPAPDIFCIKDEVIILGP